MNLLGLVLPGDHHSNRASSLRKLLPDHKGTPSVQHQRGKGTFSKPVRIMTRGEASWPASTTCSTSTETSFDGEAAASSSIGDDDKQRTLRAFAGQSLFSAEDCVRQGSDCRGNHAGNDFRASANHSDSDGARANANDSTSANANDSTSASAGAGDSAGAHAIANAADISTARAMAGLSASARVGTVAAGNLICSATEAADAAALLFDAAQAYAMEKIAAACSRRMAAHDCTDTDTDSGSSLALRQISAGIARPTVSQTLQAGFKRFTQNIKRLFSIKDASASLWTAKPLIGFYSTCCATAVTKTAGSTMAAAGAQSLAFDTGMNGTGLGLAVVEGIFACRDAIDMAGGIATAKGALIEHCEAARRFRHQRQDASAADARAYQAFMSAARKIPRLQRDARDALMRTRLSVARDTGAFVAGGILANAKTIGAAAGTIGSAASAGLSLGTGAAAMIAGPIDIASGVYEYHGARRLVEATEQRLARGKCWHQEGEAQAGSLRSTMFCGWQAMQDRLHSQDNRASLFGMARIGKGALSFGMGAASVGVSAALLAGASVGVATAGVGLAVGAGVFGVLFLAFSAYRQYRKWRTEHRSKQRQRQAQALIKTCTTQELAGMCERGERRRVLIESRGRLLYQDVQLAQNEYLALHLLAVRMAQLAVSTEGGMQDTARQELEGFMAVIGVEQAELDAIFMLAREVAQTQRVEFIKKQIASAFGVVFRTEPDGHERPLPQQVLTDACIEWFAEMGITVQSYAGKRDVFGDQRDFPFDIFPQMAPRLEEHFGEEEFFDAVNALATRLQMHHPGEDMAECRLANARLRLLNDFATWMYRRNRDAAMA
ncbi:MAG: hypothetical protein ACRYGK_05820 [Janthinobacterium lividum]